MGFDTYPAEYRPIDVIFQESTYKPLSKPSVTQLLGSIFYEKTRKNGFYGMLCAEYSTTVEYSTGPEISTIEKFITSALFYICTVFSYLT